MKAVRITASEFQERVLQPLIPKWKALVKEYPSIYRDGVYLSWDRATYHQEGTVLKNTGLKFKRLPVPAQSHDIHKVIEHAINTVKAAARKWFVDHPEVQTMEGIKREFKRLFFEVLTREGIRKDIRSLRYTYRAINYGPKAGGTAGDWPAKKYR